MKSLFTKKNYLVLDADGKFQGLRPWVWMAGAFLALCLIAIWWLGSLVPEPPPTAAVQAAEFQKELSKFTEVEQKKLLYGAETAAKQAQEEKIKTLLGMTPEEAKAKIESLTADNGKLLLDNIDKKEKLEGSFRKADVAAAQEKVVAELGAKNAEIARLTKENTDLRLQLNGASLAGAAQPEPAADAPADDATRIANANRGAGSVESDRQFLQRQPQPQPRPAAGPTPRPTVTQRRAVAQQPAPAQASGPVDRGYAAQIIAAAQSGSPLTVRPVNPNDPEIRIKGDPGEKGIRYSELKRIDPNFSVRLQ